ncbi:MAG: tRNA (adenosine(37)-N6)-threonylcarbamoyltransferase complex transferase subunit TsaD [Bacteroidales bacterium]|nr:tRNA (adenosine(37)-N6)-threonylcarbamoyltransferase complex transferase subunit TsaD [Bacteroidales bacterium]
MLFNDKEIIILGIETSCDDTSIAILKNNALLSNVVYNQDVHNKYGGVVPEFASRAHLLNIIPVLECALDKASIKLSEVNAISFTNGPGLMGSLLVGNSFAKGLAVALGKPLIAVNHLHAHVLSHFIKLEDNQSFPTFPHLSLLISGGHTQIIIIHDYLKYEIIGNTLDDAAGEAFDKAAKMMGFPYPGGPYIDNCAQKGNPHKFQFPIPTIPNLDFSFSGIKTSLLYFLRDNIQKNQNFINENINDICASYQRCIVDFLILKIKLAVKQTGIREVTLSGGVSANSEVRRRFKELENENIKIYLPPKFLTTDNAAMVGIVGYYKYLAGMVDDLKVVPFAKC